ncbi:MAG TPA: prephenate dehydrogenase/arogenate dehydrogenase family protein [Cytophagaceae bacterium]|jgi:prephenate dehydrogenase
MRELGFIGFGNFGQFIIPHLKPYFQIFVYDKLDYSEQINKLGVKLATLEEAASKEIVVVGVPVQYLETLLAEIQTFINPKALVVDISSVKVKPVDLMLKYLPPETSIIGTHPLFGPQSGKNGIKGLNLVVCPVRTKKGGTFMRFFSKELKLNVLERTPIIHDKQMAYVQALTHFIGRAVNEMDIPDVEQKTPAYQYLLDIKRNLGQDSMDLFLTIEKENPYAAEIREQFLEELFILQKKIGD